MLHHQFQANRQMRAQRVKALRQILTAPIRYVILVGNGSRARRITSATCKTRRAIQRPVLCGRARIATAPWDGRMLLVDTSRPYTLTKKSSSLERSLGARRRLLRGGCPRGGRRKRTHVGTVKASLESISLCNFHTIEFIYLCFVHLEYMSWVLD